MLGSAHGVWLASFFLIASAWAWVIWPLLTSSARVSATAFWKAALISAWLLPISTAKCFMKLPQTVDAEELAATADWVVAAGLKPKLMPAAEAVTTTAAPATATAPTAR